MRSTLGGHARRRIAGTEPGVGDALGALSRSSLNRALTQSRTRNGEIEHRWD